VPLGIVAIIFAVSFLKLPKHNQRPQVDVFGILTMAIAVTSLILATSWGGNQYAWDSWQIIGLFAVTVVFAVIFVLVERRAAEPIIPLHLFAQRNFNLTTLAGLIIAIAMFGVIGYMPTYLQMSTGVSATVSGLMLIPMVAGLLIASIVAGQIVTRTGRYKWAPILSTIIVTAGVLLLSRLTVDTPTWVLMAYIFVLGTGIGVGMQNLILIVQNTFPAREVGTATAANNFFRQIGASLGSSIVGSIFTARLTDLLSERLPAQAVRGAGSADANSLTPDLVKHLPQQIQDIIVGAYNDALTPIFLYIAPLVVAALVLVLFIKEKPLATTIEGSGAPDGAAAAEIGIGTEVLPKPAHGRDEQNDSDPAEVPPRQPAEAAATARAEFTPRHLSTASLDVLTAAQDQAEGRTADLAARRAEVNQLLDDAAHRLDATAAVLHTELREISEQLRTAGSRTADGGTDGGDYEGPLLLDAQHTASRVTAEARTQAEGILADAEDRRRELETRIEDLRRLENELTSQISARLRGQEPVTVRSDS
jgi:hypothetical protein